MFLKRYRGYCMCIRFTMWRRWSKTRVSVHWTVTLPSSLTRPRLTKTILLFVEAFVFASGFWWSWPLVPWRWPGRLHFPRDSLQNLLSASEDRKFGDFPPRTRLRGNSEKTKSAWLKKEQPNAKRTRDLRNQDGISKRRTNTYEIAPAWSRWPLSAT